MKKRKYIPSVVVVLAIISLLLLPCYYACAGWEIQGAVPTKNQLRAVWAHSATDVFAVGDYGTILHYDGDSWSGITVGAYNIYGVWGTSGTDVFAVADKGIILHYDGATWKNMTSGTAQRLRDVRGFSSTDVFATGENGTTLHYDGTTWSSMSNATRLTLQGVWGISGDDLYAVGGSSASTGPGNDIIVHYNGSTWTLDYTGGLARLHDLWGSSATNIFTVGESGGIFHYDGTNWTSVDNPVSGNSAITLRDIWGASEQDIFAVGDSGAVLHYDGMEWKSMNSKTGVKLHGVGGSSASDVFAVGEDGTIIRYDGKDDDGNNGTCIFTAVLGKGNPELDILRRVRDDALVKSALGGKLVAFYYSCSRLLVPFIDQQPLVRQGAKQLLESVLPLMEKMVTAQVIRP
jgi:hypothetical protein